MAPYGVTLKALLFVSFSCFVAADSKRLLLQSYSNDGVQGCYEHNQTLGVCFDVKKGSLKITKTAGEGIMQYLKLGQDNFFYKVLDHAFAG